MLYNRVKQRFGYGQGETLKEIVEEQAQEQNQEENLEDTGEDIDLTPQEHDHALNKAYISFRIPGIAKADIDTYIEKITPHIKRLIEEQIKNLGSAKIQLHVWIKWKKEDEDGNIIKVVR